jgi:hypothetical protein
MLFEYGSSFTTPLIFAKGLVTLVIFLVKFVIFWGMVMFLVTLVIFIVALVILLVALVTFTDFVGLVFSFPAKATLNERAKKMDMSAINPNFVKFLILLPTWLPYIIKI